MKIYYIKVYGHDMVMFDSIGEVGKIKDNPPFTAYAAQHLKELQGVRVVRVTAEAVGKVDSVLELCCGAGFSSCSIQEINRPARHVAVDISEDCVQSVARSLPKVSAVAADCYQYDMGDKSWDWVHSDFNHWTAMALLKGKDTVLSNMFAGAKQYVSLTDSALFGVYRFRKNLEAYARAMGRDLIHWEQYYPALRDHILEKFGFTLVKVTAFDGYSVGQLLFKRGAAGGNIDFTVNKGSLDIELIKVESVRQKSI